jgi:hypothetical protein
MQCILCKIYLWKIFHTNYNLICILHALLFAQNFYSCKKWVLQLRLLRVRMQMLKSLQHYLHQLVLVDVELFDLGLTWLFVLLPWPF